MAVRRTPNGNDGRFVVWLQANLADLKKISAEHDERMGLLERSVQIQQSELLETRRQTREIVAELSRLDVARRRDHTALVRTLKQFDRRIRRQERRA